jgi:putative oxidoreductase
VETQALLVRLAAGAVFVIFGAGKFINHASEVASFHTYGLPQPDAFASAIGVLELVGGVLVIAGLATRPTALLLAGDMVGAIIFSGIGQGELISFTLAPAELAAMVFLIRAGPGRYALGTRVATGAKRRPTPAPPAAGQSTEKRSYRRTG